LEIVFLPEDCGSIVPLTGTSDAAELFLAELFMVLALSLLSFRLGF